MRSGPPPRKLARGIGVRVAILVPARIIQLAEGLAQRRIAEGLMLSTLLLRSYCEPRTEQAGQGVGTDEAAAGG